MKIYKLSISSKVRKFLKRHPELVEKFAFSFHYLCNGIYQSYDIKPLKGSPNHYRLRIGKYRFLYEIIDDKLLIYCYNAGSRGGIY